jgi:K+-sensing histidine kinase KdpD
LSIVKSVVDAHDWDIRISQSQSGGARFEIVDIDLAPIAVTNHEGTE